MSLKKGNVLIVDDDYDMLELLQRNLAEQNFHVYRAASVTEAMDVLNYSGIDLLITDLQMPEINGMELVKYMEEHFPEVPKLVITGFPSVSGAIESVKSGALDYLTKPFTKEELKIAVEKSFDPKTHAKPKAHKNRNTTNYAGMVGHSSKFEELVDVIERVKNNRATVLIQGESGTGKELVARAIHYKGAFAANPFIAVNCGAIPENLLESELFGYVKGSFTGAHETRKGFFQAAEGGTIFLDEIGSAPPNVQTSLLRVLQEKEIRMIGSKKTEKINLRVIAATNNDLYQMTEKNSFRKDLYYRLNVVNIHTAPLRERRSDIPFLIDNFITKYGLEYGKPGVGISEKALKLFLRYPWPGNIRELENMVQRAIIMCENSIEISHLPDQIKYPKPISTSNSVLLPLKEIEKNHILKVLASVDNNKTKAAEILQIDRKTLREKIK